MDINTMVRIADITGLLSRREGGTGKVEWGVVGVHNALLKVRKAEEEFVVAWEKVCGQLDAELPTLPVEVLDFFPDAMRPVAEWHHEAGDSGVVAAYLNQLALYTTCEEEASAIIATVKQWEAQLTLRHKAEIVLRFESFVLTFRDIMDRREDDPSIGDIQNMAIQFNFMSAWRWLQGRLQCADLISPETEVEWGSLQTELRQLWEQSTNQDPFTDPVLNTLAEWGGGWWTKRPSASSLPLR